jgi:predicted KAP-like P-loop ATPase
MSFVPDLEKLDKLEFFHDEPDPISDVFGYHNFSENLVGAISKQKDTPFSILVHGEWGSGKTSVLVKTEANLKKLQENDANLNVILFEVWKYERVDPVATLLEEIKGKVLGKNSKRFSEIAKSVGLLLFDMAVRAHTNLSLDDGKKYFEDSLSGIRNLREEMKILMEDKKLVILFDDLDRCSFETMLELVEAIRLFLSAQGIICVVAADNERLRAAWRNKYPTANENETDEYFDKIFQLKLSLPEKEQKVVSDFIRNLNPSYIGDEEKNLINLSTSNPRKIKQILNLIFFSLKYSKLSAKLSGNLSEYYPIIVTWSIINVLYPRFGNILKTHPSSLNEILDFISLIKITEKGFYAGSKVNVDDEKLAEEVFMELNNFPKYDANHYLTQKRRTISMLSAKCLKIMGEDFSLFSFFWHVLEYLKSNIKIPTATTSETGREHLESVKFVKDEIVHDVIKQIGLL